MVGRAIDCHERSLDLDSQHPHTLHQIGSAYCVYYASEFDPRVPQGPCLLLGEQRTQDPVRMSALLASTWVWGAWVLWGGQQGWSQPVISLGSDLDPVKKQTGSSEEGRRRSLLSAAHPGICNGTGRSLPSPGITAWKWGCPPSQHTSFPGFLGGLWVGPRAVLGFLLRCKLSLC